MTMKTVEASETAKKRKRDFIAKATQKYGEGTYSYDRCDYIISHIKVIITCPTHGDFEQTPNRHIHCNTTISCPKCKHKPEETIPRITTLPDWLHFAKDDCVISDTRVARILHISVTQLRAMVEQELFPKPAIIDNTQTWTKAELLGHITLNFDTKNISCAKKNKQYNSQFVKTDAVSQRDRVSVFKDIIKGDDYSIYTVDCSQYISRATPIKITCSIHGDFMQTPMQFLNIKCPQCYEESECKTQTCLLDSINFPAWFSNAHANAQFNMKEVALVFGISDTLLKKLISLQKFPNSDNKVKQRNVWSKSTLYAYAAKTANDVLKAAMLVL